MDKDLLNKFDKLIENKGYKNRSEAVRDLVRDALVKQVWEDNNQYVAGSILIFYDHHQKNLIEEITDIQHDYHDQILGTMHFHIDKHSCLELIIIKGKANELQLLSDQIISMLLAKDAQSELWIEKIKNNLKLSIISLFNSSDILAWDSATLETSSIAVAVWLTFS